MESHQLWGSILVWLVVCSCTASSLWVHHDLCWDESTPHIRVSIHVSFYLGVLTQMETVPWQVQCVSSSAGFV